MRPRSTLVTVGIARAAPNRCAAALLSMAISGTKDISGLAKRSATFAGSRPRNGCARRGYPLCFGLYRTGISEWERGSRERGRHDDAKDRGGFIGSIWPVGKHLPADRPGSDIWKMVLSLLVAQLGRRETQSNTSEAVGKPDICKAMSAKRVCTDLLISPPLRPDSAKFGPSQIVACCSCEME